MVNGKLLIIVVLLMATMLSCNSGKEQRIIGVKLYEYNNDFRTLIDDWKNIGINTVFIDENLIQKPDFMQLCADNGIATYFIARTFWNPERLADDSTLYAITSTGEKAIDDWVHFVCPTREEYRKERIQHFTDIVKKYNPTGISIDFIRYFAFWEMVYPDTNPDSIPNTCFCDECLAKFQQYCNFSITENLSTTQEKSAWIVDNHGDTFKQWKCDNITSMVRDIVVAVKEVKPNIKVNTHTVPWRKDDFAIARERVTGQAIADFAKYADYVSPMCYSFMLKRDPEWIGELVAGFNAEAPDKVLPSIQVKEAYIEKSITGELFEKCLREALGGASQGAVLWAWDAFDAEPAYRQIMKKVVEETRK